MFQNSTDNVRDGAGQYVLDMFREAAMRHSVQFPVMFTENGRIFVQAATVTGQWVTITPVAKQPTTIRFSY